jgi:hypothetical protein
MSTRYTKIGNQMSFHTYLPIQDSTVIIDGLTKVWYSSCQKLRITAYRHQNWRLPGWRVCWVIGPKNLITALSQSGSFLDGGANHP